ncbi:hypothetical protein C8R46DRAFT_1065195 [Mycena filopes]|nr:hypothetical protein C8R46DRAFT_1065195 [Mycena filopes]
MLSTMRPDRPPRASRASVTASLNRPRRTHHRSGCAHGRRIVSRYPPSQTPSSIGQSQCRAFPRMQSATGTIRPLSLSLRRATGFGGPRLNRRAAWPNTWKGLPSSVCRRGRLNIRGRFRPRQRGELTMSVRWRYKYRIQASSCCGMERRWFCIGMCKIC